MRSVTDTEPRPDRRTLRHAATKQEIVDAAWALARGRGLGAWSLRELAAAVGMRAPSLYVYFPSKNAVYDAMFAEGYEALLSSIGEAMAEVEARQLPTPEVLRAGALLFFDFSVADPARYQLLFLRTLPGFEPSEESFALARIALDRTQDMLAAAGAGRPDQLDLWTAMLSGLASQQVSNDPGGDRWRRLVVPAVDMFVATQLPGSAQPGSAAAPAPTIGE
jgi:AcrR family transcriptional regulator